MNRLESTLLDERAYNHTFLVSKGHTQSIVDDSWAFILHGYSLHTTPPQPWYLVNQVLGVPSKILCNKLVSTFVVIFTGSCLVGNS